MKNQIAHADHEDVVLYCDTEDVQSNDLAFVYGGLRVLQHTGLSGTLHVLCSTNLNTCDIKRFNVQNKSGF